MTQLSYAGAGVSIEAGDELVERIKPAAKRTLIPGVLNGIGGFGALFEIGREYRNPVLVSGTTSPNVLSKASPRAVNLRAAP